MVVDLMIMSRAQATWRQYIAWFGVFEEWAAVMAVDITTASPERLRSTLCRALALMWHGAGYAASTLELFATATTSVLKDQGRADLP